MPEAPVPEDPEQATTVALARAILREHLPLLVGVDDLLPWRDPEGRPALDRDGRLVFAVSDYPRQDAHVEPGARMVELHEGGSVWVVQHGEVTWYVPPLDSK